MFQLSEFKTYFISERNVILIFREIHQHRTKFKEQKKIMAVLFETYKVNPERTKILQRTTLKPVDLRNHWNQNGRDFRARLTNWIRKNDTISAPYFYIKHKFSVLFTYGNFDLSVCIRSPIQSARWDHDVDHTLHLVSR